MSHSPLFSLILIAFLHFCSSKESGERSSLLALVALGSSAQSQSKSKTCTTPTPSCSTSPTFANIQSNSTHTNCTNSCHKSDKLYGNFDFTNINDTRDRINLSQPSESLLWQKVASCVPSRASMSVHSDQTFNDLIYCWIQGGGQ